MQEEEGRRKRKEVDEGDDEEDNMEDGGKGGRGGGTGGIRNQKDDVEKETRLDARGMLRRGR